MSKATYWQRGESLDYKNSGTSKIDANTIVAIGKLTGVVGTDIAPSEVGSVHISGIFEMPKTDETEIKMGAVVYFDGTGITTSADNGKTSSEKVEYTPAGYAAADAGASAENVLVKLLG